MATLGPLNPTIVDDGSDGAVIWLNMTNIYSSNNVRAASDALGGTNDTDRIYVRGFGASIDGTVVGILAEIESRCGNTNRYITEACLIDRSINSNIDSCVIGTINTTQTELTGTDVYYSRGSSTDMWGLNSTQLTEALVNSDNFGVGFRFQKIGGGSSSVVEIDHVRVTIYYTPTNSAPVVSVAPTVNYGGFTRLGTGNTPVAIGFTATDAEQQTSNALSYQIRTASSGGGTLVASGTCTHNTAKTHNLAYNATGVVNGDQTLYLRISDGTNWSADSSFVLKRDATNPTVPTPVATYDPNTGTYVVEFTPTDTYSIAAGELAYEIRTQSGGSGDLLTFGTATTAVEVETIAIEEALSTGAYTRYVRVTDTGGNIGAASFTVTVPAPDQNISFTGISTQEVFGTVFLISGADILTQAIVSEEDFGTTVVTQGYVPERVIFTLTNFFAGVYGPVQYEFGLNYYNEAGVLLGDLADDVINMSIDWDMNRTVQRTLDFSLLSKNNPLEHSYLVEPYALVQVYNPNTRVTTPTVFSLGFYMQTKPRQSIGTLVQHIYTAHDRTSLLAEKTLEEQLTIGAGQNYGSRIRQLAVAAGFSDRDILLPGTSQTLPVPLTFEPGTTYSQIINTLADYINWSHPFMTNADNFKIIERKDLTTLAKKQTFATDNTSSILPDVAFATNLLKVPNKVIVSVNDPLRTPFTATYINDHVDNPYSRSITGKTVTETIDNMHHFPDQETAEEWARLQTQLLSSNAEIELKTLLDFTREPHEVYSIFITDQETGEALIYSDWYCVSWSMNLTTGGEMILQLKNILPV